MSATENADPNKYPFHYPPIAKIKDVDWLGAEHIYFVFDFIKSKLYYDEAMKRPVKCGLGHHMTGNIRHKTVACDNKKCQQLHQVTVEMLK